MPVRVMKIVGGFALVIYGVTHPSLGGLVMMMLGMVPFVTGLAGVCLVEELVKGMEAHRPRPRERHS